MIGIVCAFFHTEGKGFYSKHYYFYHLGDLNIISFSIPDSTSRNLNASDSENSREVLWKAETDRSENLLHSKYKEGQWEKQTL